MHAPANNGPDRGELRPYLRDLAALTALPAVWIRSHRSHIAPSLAEVLMKVLDPDFVYVRLKGSTSQDAIEATRSDPAPAVPGWEQAIGRELAPWVAGGTTDSAILCLPHPLADGTVQAAVTPISYRGEFGVMVAAARQPDFPREEERLLLSVVANQAALVLQRQQAAEAQSRLAAIVESSDDAIVSKSLDGIIRTWNGGAERIFGYTAEEAIGQPILLLIPPERHSEELEIMRRLRRGERVDHFETVRLTKDGRRLDMSITISPIRDSSGAVIGASKIGRDITARKRAEEALRASEERFHFLAETIPSIVWTAAPDGTITYANRRWLEYCGLTAEQNARRWPELVLHPDDRQRCLAQWTEALREGKEYEIEVRNRRRDGVYRWFITRAVPLRDTQGRIVSWFGVTTDIHDQKEMQQQLLEADRRKDEFLATLAHELRNPLAPIRNALQMQRLAGSPNEDSADRQEMMERQVQHLVRLVDDLMEVSRITRGKVELRRERVELAAVVQNAVETSRPLIEAAGQQLAVTLPQQPLVLDADPVRLAQVVANLLNNAAKYTEAGGRIDLTAERNRGEVVIRVRDTGIGIPPDMLPRIFEIFTQVDRAQCRDQGGLGIGLSLVRGLVQMHGGRVEATSAGPGRGSEFTVRLPLAAELLPGSEAAGGLAVRGPSTAAPLRRILVVDDSRDAAESLGTLLQLVGSDVRTAHDGPGALEVLRTYRPGVVLLDISMPGMDGYEVARRIRRQPEFRDVILIALTGWGQEEDRRRARAAGFDHHLVKPVDFDSLQELLASL
jgi:two-component system CheB/CheR fusion protein